MEWLSDPQIWIGFLTLAVLEIVLGIDNIVFIAILAAKLPEAQRQKARRVGLLLALVMRVLLLFSLTWMMRLTAPIFSVFAHTVSGRDLILLFGGLFLIYKSVKEIHEKLEGQEGHASAVISASFASVILHIIMLDIVFSLDSVITAVGMVDTLGVMVAAVIVAVIFMLVFVGPISAFVEKHPTVKMLALAFLVLIGANLVAEGTGFKIPKGYTYFAMAFAVAVEMLNLRLRARVAPVHLRVPYTSDK